MPRLPRGPGACGAASARWAARVAASAALALAACGRGAPAPAGPAIAVVAAENAYGSVVAQIGGPYVHVTSVETNPNTDPHAFEASPAVARAFAGARLVVINGLGYDDWAQAMMAATASSGRRLVDVQTLLGLPESTPNPHLWYAPNTMPAVAAAVAADLGALEPLHAAYFQAALQRFDASLQPWNAALAAFRSRYPGTPVAVTEPVGDYLLQAAGCTIATPFSLQAAIMNGTDPAPQDVTREESLLRNRAVKVFVYNQQVTDPLTQTFESLARQNHIPIVGVYETMPAGYTYQSWMLAETQALQRAVATGASTTRL